MINCERYGRGERQVGRCERASKRGRGAAGRGCARASKRFWRVGFLMVSVMRRMKKPWVDSRLPLLACWVADFPTFQLSDLSACWLSGLSGSWKVGGTDRGAGVRRWGTCERGQKDREGAAIQRKRAQEQAHQKKGGVGTPVSIFPP